MRRTLLHKTEEKATSPREELGQGSCRTASPLNGVTFERRQDEQEVGTGSQRNENRVSRPGKGRVEKHRNVEDSSGWPVDPKAG